MCYSDDAAPPLPPVRGGADDRGDLVLRSVDDNQFAAAFAHPDTPSSVGMVVLPDVRGLHGFYKELVGRLAEAGMHSIAIDYFGRTAGLGPRGEDFEFREHVQQLTPDHVRHDVEAAAAWLRALPGAGVASVFTVGFCLGGSHSWGLSASGLDLQGCIGFYGMPSRVADRIPQMKAPLLVLAAGQDFTPVAEVEQFASDVRATGIDAELHVYPDAPHSFFDRSFAEHQGACDDAWQRILAFVERHQRS